MTRTEDITLLLVCDNCESTEEVIIDWDADYAVSMSAFAGFGVLNKHYSTYNEFIDGGIPSGDDKTYLALGFSSWEPENRKVHNYTFSASMTRIDHGFVNGTTIGTVIVSFKLV